MVAGSGIEPMTNMATPAKLIFFELKISPNIIKLIIRNSGLNNSGRILCKYIISSMLKNYFM